MILEPKDTTIAYRCPECGTTVISVVGALALSGDIIKLKCDCGGSELILENTNDGKIRLTVPCVFCPSPHRYLVSRKLLTTRELFTFPCAYAGIDILFIGSKGAVLKAIEQSDKELDELIDETEMSGIHDGNESDNLYGDEHVRDMIMFTLGDLVEEGNILCGCPDGGDFLVEQKRDSVLISCKKCGGCRFSANVQAAPKSPICALAKKIRRRNCMRRRRSAVHRYRNIPAVCLK